MIFGLFGTSLSLRTSFTVCNKAAVNYGPVCTKEVNIL